jgi:hypothetical protein
VSTATAQLIAEFEALPDEEKKIFVREVIQRVLPYDSGSLDDQEIALDGDKLTAMLEQEENGPRAL